MKIEYLPSQTRTYTTSEVFKATAEKEGVGMLVIGDSVRFLGPNIATDQWDERGFRQEKLTTELLLKFVEAYNNRGKS